MNVEQSQAQRRCCKKNLAQFLKEYEEGFIVIEKDHHQYYRTREEVNKAYPVLAQSPIFGNRPLLVDISEEQWKLKNKSLEYLTMPEGPWNWPDGWDIPDGPGDPLPRNPVPDGSN